MAKNNTKTQIKSISLASEVVICLFISMTLVSALAVGGQDVIRAYPGQIIDQRIVIQNTFEDSANLTMKGSITSGSEIVSFKDSADKIKVPANQIAPVFLKIKIPSNDPVGKEYSAAVMFETVTTSAEQGGSVSFLMNVGKEFKVVVIEKPAEVPQQATTNSTTLIVVLVIIIILAIIIWLFLRKKKGTPEK